MCGIFAILFSKEENLKQLKAKTADSASRITHRGPDWSGQHVFQLDYEGETRSFAIAHERLQIIDPYGGEQPIFDKEKKTVLAVNGEIYNYQDLIEKWMMQPMLTTGSDCEVILQLYKINRHPVGVSDQLSGVFSFILYDSQSQSFFISRDAIGVNPLYIGFRQTDGAIFLSSEIKAFQSLDLAITSFQEFPPGHYLYLVAPHSPSLTPSFDFQPWYQPKWKQYQEDFIQTANQKYLLAQIRTGLTEAVRSRLMSDAPFGFLLSGGLDSSLVCSIATRLLKLQSFRNKPVPVINTFSIGQQDSPDLKAAQKVADFLGTKHHNFTFTVDQGIAAVPNAIYHMETFDVTTIRAGTPMYLLSRRIKAMGTKMVLSGEGADELFGGYLYFHQAPNPTEFYHETVDKVNQLSQYDCRRANKSTAAWGVEVRVPFLDRDFVDFIILAL